jgi:hypothetical protein
MSDQEREKKSGRLANEDDGGETDVDAHRKAGRLATDESDEREETTTDESSDVEAHRKMGR